MNNNVIDMKGNVMQEQTPMAIEQSCEEIVNQFYAAAIAMHQASNRPEMKHVSFRDDEGRVYSISAVMRTIDRHMNHIRARVGAEYTVSNHNYTQPRR